MPRWVKICLAFIGGLVVGEAIPIVCYIVATEYFGSFDRDGGGAMGAVFLIGPLLAVVLAVTAALVAAVWSGGPAGRMTGGH
jgi:hypothetical protein